MNLAEATKSLYSENIKPGSAYVWQDRADYNVFYATTMFQDDPTEEPYEDVLDPYDHELYTVNRYVVYEYRMRTRPYPEVTDTRYFPTRDDGLAYLATLPQTAWDYTFEGFQPEGEA